MKKLLIITLSLAAILITSSCSKDDDFFGSGNITSEFRDISTFDKVYSEGTFTVNILQGPEQSVEVITNDNIIHRLKTTVSNNKLSIYLLDGNYSNINVEVNITIPNLNEIQNIGTGDISAVELNSEDNLKIENSGTGNINISGSVNNVEIKNEGSGEIHGMQLMSINSTVEIIGSGDCEVYCTETLDVNIEGSGDLYYKGSPIINLNVSGSGSVINAN